MSENVLLSINRPEVCKNLSHPVGEERECKPLAWGLEFWAVVWLLASEGTRLAEVREFLRIPGGSCSCPTCRTSPVVDSKHSNSNNNKNKKKICDLLRQDRTGLEKKKGVWLEGESVCRRDETTTWDHYPDSERNKQYAKRERVWGGMRGKASANSASAQRKIKCLILHKLLNTTFTMTPGEFHPLKEKNAKKKREWGTMSWHKLP